jgi:prepilin-type processing-associated H-X9-DG protein
MYDAAVYPWGNGANDYDVYQWHNTSHPGKAWDTKTVKTKGERIVGTVGFVDGHAKLCDFSAVMVPNLAHGLNPGPDYMWYKPLRQ